MLESSLIYSSTLANFSDWAAALEVAEAWLCVNLPVLPRSNTETWNVLPAHWQCRCLVLCSDGGAAPKAGYGPCWLPSQAVQSTLLWRQPSKAAADTAVLVGRSYQVTTFWNHAWNDYTCSFSCRAAYRSMINRLCDHALKDMCL